MIEAVENYPGELAKLRRKASLLDAIQENCWDVIFQSVTGETDKYEEVSAEWWDVVENGKAVGQGEMLEEAITDAIDGGVAKRAADIDEALKEVGSE